MTIESYLNPDFTWTKMLLFFLLAFGGILLCDLLVIWRAKSVAARQHEADQKAFFFERAENRVQCFYEMMISGTSVLFFSCAYVVCNHLYTLIETDPSAASGGLAFFYKVWGDGKDFVLLFLICMSCLLNTFLDRCIIPLKTITKEERASIRLLAMFYVILILVVLNIVGDESEYGPVMMYYLGLMVGRFVYFDASFVDFLDAMKSAIMNLPMLAMGMVLMAGLSVFGFQAGYLIERNYFIVGVFYTHLFLLLAIFVIHLIRFWPLILRKPKRSSGNAGRQE
ncbi:MAG: hypothetical protein IJJ13_08260 [Lachnospiraceae bacterium]|nr:hypothetical protein [Lachnospiraceae bacterium]